MGIESARPISASMVSTLLIVVVALASLSSLSPVQATLSLNFYEGTCPDAESIITYAVNSALSKRPAAAPGVLRMHFHDCFVRGCDASVLIDTPTAERYAIPNLTLQGFDVIEAAKTAVETKCPGVVSCADIITIAAQLSVKKMSGGKISWKVLLGRRDGLVSSISEPLLHLPPPFSDVPLLKSLFAAVGFSTQEMVVLSGAHSVGKSHCVNVADRLTTPPTPTIDPAYYAFLKHQCPAGSTNTVNLDVKTPTKLDARYYKNLQVRKGTLTSDQVLWEDSETKPLVASLTNVNLFNCKFADAMVKLGKIGILTGRKGEIRKNCFKFN